MSQQASEVLEGTADAVKTGSPWEGETIARLSSKMMRYKREITMTTNKTEKHIADIEAAMAKGIKEENNFLLEGMISTTRGMIENVKKAKIALDECIYSYVEEVENIRVSHPNLKAECDTRLENASKDEVVYDDKVRKFNGDFVEGFTKLTSKGSRPSSRDTSPKSRRRFLVVDHLLPNTLTADCNCLEFSGFKDQFETWIRASYPDGYEFEDFKAALLSKIDTIWQGRIKGSTAMISRSEEEVWKECDKIMLSLHPLHNRRMMFLASKPEREELPSQYLNRLIETAAQAKLKELTDTALILHIFSASLPQSDLNKTVRQVVIEELRLNPNKVKIREVQSKISGEESNANAIASSVNTNKVKEIKQKGFSCRFCKKSHARNECTYECSHCKRKGSHFSNDCYFKNKGEKNKRNRSKSRDRQERRTRKRDKSPRNKIRQVESDTDRDSERETSGTDTEPETEKTKRVRQKEKCRRINRNSRSSTMRGVIFATRNDKRARVMKEKFCPDTGTTVPIIPKRIAVRNNLKIEELDHDEPGCESASGHDMKIVGQTKFWVQFDNFKYKKQVHGLVSDEDGDEILLDKSTLIEWSIIPSNFPEPQDQTEKAKVSKAKRLVTVEEKRGSRRTKMVFHNLEEEEVEIERKLKELKKTLLREFADVFKTDLGVEDRINIEPVIIETIQEKENIKASNCMTPIETPIHLQKAAGDELSKMLKAGFIEPVTHATDWCSRAFFVAKPNSDPIKARLVTDFRNVNRILRRPGYPMEGSALLLKRLEPEDTMFATIDLSSGYHQVPLAEESRDLFSIILPQGKYRFTVLPQGTSSSCDIFNIVTDGDIRNKKGYFKNVDDVLTSANSVELMEKRLRNLLQICRKKNIKLNGTKFEVGRQVTFGGVTITGKREVGDEKTRVYISPTEARLDALANIKTPKSRKDVQSIIGMINQLKSWLPEISLVTTNLRKLTSPNVRFAWSEDLNKELEEVKNRIKSRVQLSPLDLSRPIHIHTDAAQTVGMAYVLCQPRTDDEKDGKNIITCNSTHFKDAQKNYSPFECELLAIQWATKSLDYYIRGAREVRIFTDAKGMGGLFNTSLGKIENDRIRGMIEHTLPYSLTFTHVKGSKNGICDFGSRFPLPGAVGEEFPLRNPTISHKSKRVMEKGVDAKDPMVWKLAETAMEDEEYIRMINDIKNRIKPKDMNESSELKKIEGEIKNLSIHTMENGKQLIVRNGCEVLIPKKGRKEIIEILHQTHLETESMKRLARNKFFWPKFGKDIEQKYNECKECKENAISKTHKTEMIPPDLTLLAPGEEIQIDYASFGNRKMIVIKDRASGFLNVVETKNQTTEEAMRAIHEWSFTYGLPHVVRSDGGPAFRKGFSSYLEGMGILHKLSSPYNSQSNGLAERGVRQIKDVLQKKKKVDKQELQKIVFDINNHVQKREGTAAERFFRRSPRSNLPNSVNREIDHRNLISNRHKKQEKIATAKGRKSKDQFEVGDDVVIQNPQTKRWNIEGVIKEERVAEDNNTYSYIISLNEGGTTLRNKRFLKHAKIKHVKRVAFAEDTKEEDGSAPQSREGSPNNTVVQFSRKRTTQRN